MTEDFGIAIDDGPRKSYLPQYFEKAKKKAERNGMEVILSTPTTLLLDLDTGTQRDQYKSTLPRVKGAYPGLIESSRWTSKGGEGMHVVLTLPAPMTVTERLLLQCVLGSDPIREMLGLALLKDGIENPIMLFKPKKTD